MGITRFSINSIVWFGEDMKQFDGIVTGDDEEFMSCIKPTLEGKANCFCGSTLISHFAFRSQRKILDQANILEQYGNIMFEQWKDNQQLYDIHCYTQRCMDSIAKLSEKAFPEFYMPPYSTPQKENKLAKRIKFLLGRLRERQTAFIKN